MKIGLIGLSQTGKTTVFNLLAGRGEDTAHAGGRAPAQRAVIKVPDPRLDRLAAVYHPKKITHAEIDFTDLAGFEHGKGGLPQARINEMRNLDALVHVLRAFESPVVAHAGGSSTPVADAQAIEQELILTDLLLVERFVERMQADIGKGRKELIPELELMRRLAEALSAERPLRSLAISPAEADLLRGYQFLSRYPMILLANVDEKPDARQQAALAAIAEEGGLGYLALNAQAEWEIAQLPVAERAAFLADLGVSEPARDRFIRSCFELLDLISFFTVGDDDVHAWTVRKGASAQEAAGKIHTDMARGFIRAETLSCEAFFVRGSMAEARKHGELRLEGKEYVVQDGDILTIRFSV
jgi:hypothetical protein